MNKSELSEGIRKGNLNAIMEGFLSNGALYRAWAIFGCVNNHVFNSAIERQLNKLVDDDSMINGRTISQYAIAALCKLKSIEYDGDSEDVRILMNAEKWFN